MDDTKKLLIGLLFNLIIIIIGFLNKRTASYSKSFIPIGYLLLAISAWIFGFYELYHIEKYQDEIKLYSFILLGYIASGTANFFLFLKYK